MLPALKTSLAGILGLAAVACGQDLMEAGQAPAGPGSEAWGAHALSCNSHNDCASGEGCYENVCQPKQCELAANPSSAPLGPVHEFAVDHEIAALDGGTVRLYEPSSTLGSLSELGSVDGTGVIELVRGRPGIDGLPALGRVSPAGVDWLLSDGATMSVTFPANATRAAAGDLDHDGRDDIAFITSQGGIYVCGSQTSGCQSIAGISAEVHDFEVAWFGAEVGVAVLTDAALVHVAVSGTKTIAPLDGASDIAIDDLDGDGIDEVVVLQPGFWPWGDDRLASFKWQDATLVEIASAEVPNARSLAIGDLDADGTRDLALLTTGGDVRIYQAQPGDLTLEGAISLGLDGDRITLVDRDDDSARARLVEGPVLVPGNPVPVLAVTFPPYHRDHSAGKPTLSIGTFEGIGESISKGVSLELGVEVGVSVGGEGLLSAGFTGALSRRVRTGSTKGRSFDIGDWLDVDAQPDLYGDSYGAVILGVGCYEAYRYEVIDPDRRTGELDGEELVMFVPVGAETSLWSSTRYNALAKVRGDLPVLEVATRLGNPKSYPRVPSTIDGRILSPDEMVVPDPPSFGVSDVAEIGWTLTLSESRVETTSMSRSIGGKASVGAFGVKLGVNATLGQGFSHSLSLSDAMLVRGRTPPLADDPTTPEDEYSAEYFGFGPVFYMHSYTTESGEEGSFYALSFVLNDK